MRRISCRLVNSKYGLFPAQKHKYSSVRVGRKCCFSVDELSLQSFLVTDLLRCKVIWKLGLCTNRGIHNHGWSWDMLLQSALTAWWRVTEKIQAHISPSETCSRSDSLCLSKPFMAGSQQTNSAELSSECILNKHGGIYRALDIEKIIHTCRCVKHESQNQLCYALTKSF